VPRAKVISFINYKGGVGKTTSTYHVGCWLAQQHDQKVLLIDIDPQTNLTFLCSPIELWEKQKKRVGTIATIYDRFQRGVALDTKRYIWKTPIKLPTERLPNVDLIPCDIELLGEDLGGSQISGTFATLDAVRKHAKQYLKERMFLIRAIREVEDAYDFVLIDCPPNLYLMTQNALAASENYVVTAIPDHLSTIGLNILVSKVRKIDSLLSSAYSFAAFDQPLSLAKLGGVIFVKVRQGGEMITTTHDATMEAVGEQLGANYPFKTYTTELIGYSEAAERSLPVWELSSENARRAADQYPDIANEFMTRFGR
jgi:chromosome partitioning protein